MKDKKILYYFIIAVIVILVIGIVFFLVSYNSNSSSSNQITEYTPQQELSDEEIRKTIVSVYFKNIETNTLVPESVCIDVKELSDNPYMKLLNLLLSGPTNDKLENPLPEGTKINKAYLKENTVYVDFSNEFITNAPTGVEEESLIIYSIVNTLTELNEVSSVKILINNEENLSFSDNAMNFKEEFVRND